jgi:hypothetical protein
MMLSFAIMPAVSFDAERPAQVRAFVRAFIVDGLGPGPEDEPGNNEPGHTPMHPIEKQLAKRGQPS